MYVDLFILALTLYVLLTPKGNMTVKLQDLVFTKKLGFVDKIFCYVPFYNTYLSRRALTGHSTTTLVLFYIFVAINIFNLVVRFVLYQNQGLQIASTILMIAGIILWYVSEVVLAVQVTLLFAKPKTLIFVIIPAISSAILTPIIAKRIKKEKHKLEGTFDGKRKKSNTDTVQT